jgi:predicted sulfurtransferase
MIIPNKFKLTAVYELDNCAKCQNSICNISFTRKSKFSVQILNFCSEECILSYLTIKAYKEERSK